VHGIIYFKRDRHTSRGRLEPCDRVYLCSKKHVYCTCIPRCENAPSSTASGTLVASVAETTIFIASLGIWRRNFLTLRRERERDPSPVCEFGSITRERESKTRKILSYRNCKTRGIRTNFFFVSNIELPIGILDSLFTGIIDSFVVIT